MEPQALSWTCSIASFTWVINSTGTDPNLTRDRAAEIIGYPDCVNETYGCMSTQCLINAYAQFGLYAHQAWVTYDQAFAIMSQCTGQINPIGMYHYMAIRGAKDGALWVANSAQGYMGVYDKLYREQFNDLGPVQLVYLP